MPRVAHRHPWDNQVAQALPPTVLSETLNQVCHRHSKLSMLALVEDIQVSKVKVPTTLLEDSAVTKPSKGNKASRATAMEEDSTRRTVVMASRLEVAGDRTTPRSRLARFRRRPTHIRT